MNMLNINFSGIKNSFGTINLINISLDGKKNSTRDLIKSTKEFDYGKNQILMNFSNFCGLPHFEIANATMDKLLVRSFYDVIIKLTNDFDYTISQFEYFKNNLLAKGVKTKTELVGYLITEREQINQNDSRFYLGFRSIYSVLNNNIENVSYEYLAEINQMLAPFFVSYKHKELLFGLSYIEK